jgi:monoamine oxidase
MIYDYCIVGGGIAGLYCALKLVKKNKVLLCEKYKNLGGKVSTYYGYVKSVGDIQYEEGAGRISNQHTLILKLIKRYKLTLIPINPEIRYKKDGSSEISENYFEPSLHIFITPLKNASKETLESHTLRELLEKIHGKKRTDDYLNRFPYRAEVDVLRADMGLEVFLNEMKSHEGYFVLKEGLSALINCMKDEFLKCGGKIANSYECVDIFDEKEEILTQFLCGPLKLKDKRKTVFIRSKKLICALPSEALKKISYFNNLNTLNYVKMEPLLRTYAVYPTEWFKNMGRIVTDTHIRYFLPISPKVAMVSYTDSSDAQYYGDILNSKGEEFLGETIQKELKQLFPEKTVPNYLFFKSHFWKYGATYWCPGDYDVKKESEKSLKPFDSEVYIVGESFSTKQAWMEGALEQCEKFFNYYS